MKIVVDAMGGDFSPDEIVKGAVLAAKEFDVGIILAGDQEKLTGLVGGCPRVEILHAPDCITFEEDALAAAKSKKESSMVKGIMQLKNGKADGFVTAGSTGALIAATSLYVKRLKGVRRMALAPVIPCDGKPLLLMDAGANMDCQAEYLVQFGVMGSLYMEKAVGIKNPRVGLLNVGTEETKGDQLSKEAYALLKESSVNFVGNVEASAVLSHPVDVLVCDGFAGNILLKSLEGALRHIRGKLKKMFMANSKTKVSALLLKKEFKEFKDSFSFGEVGGAVMLGAAGTVVKAHGNSKSHEIFHAIRQAISFSENKINKEIQKSID